MERETIKEEIEKVISDTTGIKVELEESQNLMDDLELSSMEIMTMVADVERRFKIKIKESDMREIVTVEDLINAVAGKLDEK